MSTDAGQRLIEDLRKAAQGAHRPTWLQMLLLESADEIKRLRGVERAARSIADKDHTYVDGMSRDVSSADVVNLRKAIAASSSTGAADVGEDRV